MRRVAVLSVLGAAALVAGVLATSASASGGGSFQVTAITKQAKNIDVGPRGTNIGDYSVFSDNVFRNGRSVGELNGVCTHTRIDPAANQGSQQCVITVTLPRGNLMLQDVIRFSGVQVKSVTAAVTGGTGHFAGATGTAHIRFVSDTTSKIRFVLQ